MQLFYALRVEDACDSVRPEEYCNIQHDGNGGDGDEGVAQYATDFLMIALSVAETNHGLSAVCNAVENRVDDIEYIDNNCVCRNRSVAAKMLK